MDRRDKASTSTRTGDMYAPYNFVPLSTEVFTCGLVDDYSHDVPFRDGLCGWLDLTIEAATPLLVGGAREKASDREAGWVEFCKLPDGGESFYIPGSSLRGLIRNVIEIAGFSRFNLVDDRRFSFRDLSGGNQRGGMIRKYMDRMNGDYGVPQAGWLFFEDGRWKVTPCKYARIRLSEICDVKPRDLQHKPAPVKYAAVKKYLARKGRGLEGYFRVTQRDESPDKEIMSLANEGEPGARPGCIVVTGQPNPKKTKEFVFFGTDNRVVPVPEEVMNGFRDIHETESTATSHFGREDRDQTTWQYFRSADRIPVFFHEDGGKVRQLGLSRMYKVPADRTIHELRRNSGDHKAREDELDLAEAMFGRVFERQAAAHSEDGDGPPGKDEKSLKGRLSFGHARLTSDHKPVEQPPAILSNPKASFVPGYIHQHETQRPGQLRHGADYAHYLDDTSVLRGWKRYPVRPLAAAAVQEIPDNLKSKRKMQTRLRTLPAGVRFHCRLRIHNMKPFEVGALLWALTFGDSPAHAHALGMGKPFGFGQIRIGLNGENPLQHLTCNDGNPLVPEVPNLIQTFVGRMEDWAKGTKNLSNGWSGSDQITALLAMADPEQVTIQDNGVAQGAAGPLRYMELEDFRDGKKALKVLEPYAPIRHTPKKAGGSAAAAATRAAGAGQGAAGDPGGGFRYRKGDRVYAYGEEAVLCENVTENDAVMGRKVEVDYGDNDIDVISAKELKPVNR